MKIITIVGARPQFIKAAAVSRAIAQWNQQNPTVSIDEKIVHTGQHYDQNMSEVFFKELHIPKPHTNLNIGSGKHGQQTGEMLSALEELYQTESPGAVLVYGDTNSTLAGALAASKLHIPVVHVEAGLRSYNKKMPEEQNRILTDHLSTILCCPTQTAIQNLQKEGFDTKSIPSDNLSFDRPWVCLTGDVMLDCTLYYDNLQEKQDDLWERLGLKKNGEFLPFVLSTIHRAENTDDLGRLENILSTFAVIVERIPIILPLHPRTAKIISQSAELKSLAKSLQIIEPVSYLEMLALEKHGTLICTDSGGLQKEAYFLRTPCITMRDQTEWVETVELGWNKIVGADREQILSAVEQIQEQSHHAANESPFEGKVKQRSDCYGDGNAAQQIINCLRFIHGQD
jgi:UDP-GlcNAc3NAcA epimerase